MTQAGRERDVRTPDAPWLERDAECERCGAVALEWRNCKLICPHCRSIVKSCADL